MSHPIRIAVVAILLLVSFSSLSPAASSALAQPAEQTGEPPPAAPGPPDETTSPAPPGPADKTISPAAESTAASRAPWPPPEQGKPEVAGPAGFAEPPLPEAAAAPAESKESDPWSMIEPGTLWYLYYEGGRGENRTEVSRVGIGRGYLTLKLKPVEWFNPRITLDAHQNEDGDFAVRLKYLYAMFRVPVETSVLTEPNIELGLVHIPWLDFEEHVNLYRAEGTMFIERNSVLNSADAGATAGGLLGRKLPGEYRDQVSSQYPGTWGSFALGVYNGGGYHAAEQNRNKVFMGRLTVRPLGPLLPNLQLSYFNVTGKGNTADPSDWSLHDVMASFEHRYLVLTAQIAAGEGNQKGDKVDDSGEALALFGWSVFGEIRLPWILSSLIGRYDWMDWDTSGGAPAKSRVIAGYAFHFLPHNFLLASLDWVSYGDSAQPEETLGKLTLQVDVP